MIKAVVYTKNYFQAPSNYFWRWADSTEVIEWRSGATICYRNDIIEVLREIHSEGIPPLGALLLILAACKEKITEWNRIDMIRIVESFKSDTLPSHYKDAFEFLDIISSLPPVLKNGNSRIHLITEVFEKTGYIFSNLRIKKGLDELRSGRLNDIILEPGEPITKEQFANDLLHLTKALERFPTVSSLELKLRTGLNKIPEPVAIEIPDHSNKRLIDQLADDPKTAAIARLTKQLIPVINIPMHTRDSGDQSYGGISDITNRGNYDRLLLSELAHDDLLLTARLVNNEALYFRREEPPEKPKTQRTILIDTTLKMWGVPRIYAISSALAFAHNSKHGEVIESFALGGEKYAEINLSTREGVIQCLEQLHHSLHCGKALQSVVRSLEEQEQNEFILITDARMLYMPEFHGYLQSIRKELSFVVTVNRNGEIRFLECIKGNLRVLSTAKMDLEEVLYSAPVIKPKRTYIDHEKPGFFSYTPAPLLFPKLNNMQLEGRFIAMEDRGAIVITKTQRVLFIKDNHHGAIELLNFIEKGNYVFGWDDHDDCYILVRNSQKPVEKIYKINLSTWEINTFEFSFKIPFVRKAFFDFSWLYLETDLALYQFDCGKFQLSKGLPLRNLDHEQYSAGARIAEMLSMSALNKFIPTWVPYTVLYKLKVIAVTEDHKLQLGNNTLTLFGPTMDIRISVSENRQRQTLTRTFNEFKSVRLLPNKQIKFNSYTWRDGSAIITDSRGFLHLKSSDKSLPEITIVAITGVNTACWASDGKVAGSPHFLGERNENWIPTTDFYKHYIKPFIDRLK